MVIFNNKNYLEDMNLLYLFDNCWLKIGIIVKLFYKYWKCVNDDVKIKYR